MSDSRNKGQKPPLFSRSKQIKDLLGALTVPGEKKFPFALDSNTSPKVNKQKDTTLSIPKEKSKFRKKDTTQVFG